MVRSQFADGYNGLKKSASLLGHVIGKSDCNAQANRRELWDVMRLLRMGEQSARTDIYERANPID